MTAAMVMAKPSRPNPNQRGDEVGQHADRQQHQDQLPVHCRRHLEAFALDTTLGFGMVGLPAHLLSTTLHSLTCGTLEQPMRTPSSIWLHSTDKTSGRSVL